METGYERNPVFHSSYLACLCARTQSAGMFTPAGKHDHIAAGAELHDHYAGPFTVAASALLRTINDEGVRLFVARPPIPFACTRLARLRRG
jgi:hypothetical protein